MIESFYENIVVYISIRSDYYPSVSNFISSNDPWLGFVPNGFREKVDDFVVD